MFALPMLRFAVIVPDVVTGVEPMVKEPEDDSPTEVTDPAPVPAHTPFTAKHPVVILNPTFDVDVAWPEILSPLTVVVPNPPPAISKAEIDVVALPATVVVEKYRFPPEFLNAHCAIPPVSESAS